MGLLTLEEQQAMALLHKKRFIGVCDFPGCSKLVPLGSLYVVVKAKPRTDGLTFLGAIPTRIRCLTCDDRKHPNREKFRARLVEKKETSIVTLIRRLTLKVFKKKPELKIGTKQLILRLKKKQLVAKVKQRGFTKAFKELKKAKILAYKEKEWQLRKKKSVQ